VIRLTRARQALILLPFIVVTIWLSLTRPDEEPALRALAPVAVLVNDTRLVDLYPQESVSGHLQPARRAWLRFEVAGRVAQRHVEAGQRVTEGELLLELDARDYEDALVQARAEWRQEQENLERDRALLQLAERSRRLQGEEVARLEQLGERSLTSKTLLGDAKALLAQRLSEEARLRSSVETGPQRVAARKAALDLARRNLDRTRLRAPFAGRVNQVALELGDYAGSNAQAVELISDRLDFYAQVRGPVARALKLGQEVEVQVAGEPQTATVASVQPDPDPATFTHAVRLRMPPSETRSGVTAVAQLPLRPLPGALVVPATAVLLEEGQAYLFRVVGERLKRVPVRLGPRVGEQQVIASGIDAGKTVVVRDVAALADDQLVVAEAVRALEENKY
jgi:RND family efflux transporter MFP subunit